jgi:hypothetical protein
MPYYRLESPTQTSGDAKMQQASGQIWGRAASTSIFPSVKAYRGPLPPNTRGIEFTTSVAPTKGVGSPRSATWYPCLPGINPCSPQVSVVNQNGVDFAVISVTVTQNTQVP